MFSLVYKNDKDNARNTIYYLVKDEYTIGRRDCDIVLENDKHISRKHATFTIKNNNLYLTSLKIGLKTYLNDEIIQSNTETILQVGDIILLGTNHKYQVDYDPLIVVSSGLSKIDQTRLETYLLELNTKVTSLWTKSCSYLTANVIELTSKVICAIVMGHPIVTLQYWIEYIKCLSEGKLKPKVENFKPKFSNRIVRNDFSINYNPKRLTLFAGKVFVFMDIKTMNVSKDIIQLTGGDVELFSADRISRYFDFHYIFVHSTLSTYALLHVEYAEFFDYLTNSARGVPLNEISLAILKCSWVQHCKKNKLSTN